MRSLNIKNFTISDIGKITSEFISDTFSNFLDNFLYLFAAHKTLREKYETYKIVADQTFAFMATKTGANQSDLIITAYEDPVSSTGIYNPRYLGLATIEESTNSQVNLLPLVDESGTVSAISDVSGIGDGERALSGTLIYRYNLGSGQFVEDTALRNIMDNTAKVWYEELDDDELWLKLKIPAGSAEISYIDVFPYGGTGVNEITFSGLNGNDETIDITTRTEITKEYPLRIYINKQDFNNEIDIKLSGFDLGTGKYFYSLGYIHAYIVDFEAQGEIVYDIGSLAYIDQIEIIEPVIQPISLHNGVNYPIQVQIYDSVTNDIYYDTEANINEGTGLPEYPNSYPLESRLLLDITKNFYIKFKLLRTNSFSPAFRRCVLTVD